MNRTLRTACAGSLVLCLCVAQPAFAVDRSQDAQRTVTPEARTEATLGTQEDSASRQPDPAQNPDSSQNPDFGQTNDPSQSSAPSPAPDGSPAPAAPATSSQPPPTTGRLFGVLPNSSTVEANTPYVQVTTKQTFRFAVEQSFDKMVYPFVGVVALLGVGQPSESYWQRYARALTDNAVSNFNTVAFLPLLFHQDPRYFQLGAGTIWYRAGYAASRIVVTRARASGHRQFNVSELGGTAVAGVFSNVYYPAAQSTASATLARIGSQVMWDTVAFEAKEFWPDIRRSLEKAFHRHRGVS